jgi:hypothetical protein
MSFIIEVPRETIYNAGHDLQIPRAIDTTRYVLDRIEERYNVTIVTIPSLAPDGRSYIAGYSIKFSSEADATMFLLRFS